MVLNLFGTISMYAFRTLIGSSSFPIASAPVSSKYHLAVTSASLHYLSIYILILALIDPCCYHGKTPATSCEISLLASRKRPDLYPRAPSSHISPPTNSETRYPKRSCCRVTAINSGLPPVGRYLLSFALQPSTFRNI